MFLPSPSRWSPPERIAGAVLCRRLDGPLMIDGVRLLIAAPSQTIDGNPIQGAGGAMGRGATGWEIGDRLFSDEFA